MFLSIRWQPNWSNSNDIVWRNSTNRNEGFRNRTYLVDCSFVKSTSFGRIVRDSNNWPTICAFQLRLLFIPRARLGKSLLSRITFIRFADPACDCSATRFTRGYASPPSSSISNRNVKRYFPRKLPHHQYCRANREIKHAFFYFLYPGPPGCILPKSGTRLFSVLCTPCFIYLYVFFLFIPFSSFFLLFFSR